MAFLLTSFTLSYKHLIAN